jgi:hypothetical protein
MTIANRKRSKRPSAPSRLFRLFYQVEITHLPTPHQETLTRSQCRRLQHYNETVAIAGLLHRNAWIAENAPLDPLHAIRSPQRLRPQSSLTVPRAGLTIQEK